MKPTGSQIAYSLILIGEHNRGIHDETPHKMCRLCHPEEAELLDRLNEVHPNE
jgi:hypothetical protein